MPALTPMLYEIRIADQLNPAWREWFANWKLQPAEEGGMVLRGWVQDQSALFGMLMLVQRLGLSLISINPVNSPKP